MNTFRREGKEKEDAGTGAQIWRVDVDYLSTMGMKIVEGRNFSPALPSDSQAVIINQKMARDMGLKDPIGQRITKGGDHLLVIGVMEDFNFESIRQEIGPLCGAGPTFIHCCRQGGWGRHGCVDRQDRVDLEKLLSAPGDPI
jgi:putative ABC transport system permease protein